MNSFSLLIVLATASFAFGELPKFREGKIPRPTTVPTIQEISDGNGVTLALKEGAPKSVKIWFDELPTMREHRIAQLETEKQREVAALTSGRNAALASYKTDRLSHIQSLNDAIASQEQEVSRIAKTKVGTIRDGNGGAGNSVRRTDTAAQARVDNQYAAARTELGNLRRQLRELNDPKNEGSRSAEERELEKSFIVQISSTTELYDRRIKLIRENQTYIDMPALLPVNLSVNDFGFLNVSLKVVQIVDDSNLLVEIEELNVNKGAVDDQIVRRDRLVWISGFDTTDLVDDDILYSSLPLAITGTKVYQAKFGGRKKVLMMEPLDVGKWLDVVPKGPGLAKPVIHVVGGV
jgi:hypothetical protein